MSPAKLIAGLALGLTLSCPVAARVYTYEAGSYDVPVYPIGWTNAQANHINVGGSIVGTFSTATGFNGGFIYRGGTYTEFAPTGANSLVTLDINASDTVLGTYFPDDGGSAQHFLYSSGSFTNLAVPGSDLFSVRQINDAGTITGAYFDADQVTSHGFTLLDGTLTTLDFPGAELTFATAINEAGATGGYYRDTAGAFHGFFEASGSFTSIDVPGARSTFVVDINDTGGIVGYFFNAGFELYSFVYDDGIFTTLDGVAEAINDAGAVVGAGSGGAYLYVGGTYTIIQPPGSNVVTALDLNNRGTVVGNAFFVPPAIVPEPATWTMLIAGFGIVAMAARKRRAAMV